MTNYKANVRESNFELFRITSMVAIIACHYVVHGGCFSLCTRYNFIVGQLFSLGGNIGVICFCILAGYFLPISHFSFKKAFILIGEVCFYAWLWLLFAYIFHADTVNANLVTSIFPVFTGAYWFATAYIGAYILSPFLIKTCLQKSPEQPINQNRVIITVLILGFLLYVRPPYFILPVSAYYSDLFWFVFLFFVGTYLRMNPPQWFAKPNICMLLFVCPLFIMWGLLILFHYLIISNPNIGQYTSYITGRTSILGLCSSLGLFGLFKNMQIRKSPIINYIASITFGVYLFHDSVFRDFFWHTLFKTQNYYSSNLMIAHFILCLLTIFACTLFLDLLRRKCFEPLFLKILNKPIRFLDGNLSS